MKSALSGLVSLSEAFENASKKFRPGHFSLDCDYSQSRMERARDAGIFGEAKILAHSSTHGNIATIGYYKVDLIKREVPISRFLNNPVRRKQSLRPGSIDEWISFVGKYGAYARSCQPLCFNSNLFGSVSDYPLIIGFIPRQEGFEALVLERESRVLLPGDLVLSRKPVVSRA